MKTFNSIIGIEKDRTNPRAARRRMVAAGLGLAAVLAFAAGARQTYAAASPTPPVSKCEDFACQP
jgi:hypothetical protein